MLFSRRYKLIIYDEFTYPFLIIFQYFIILRNLKYKKNYLYLNSIINVYVSLGWSKFTFTINYNLENKFIRKVHFFRLIKCMVMKVGIQLLTWFGNCKNIYHYFPSLSKRLAYIVYWHRKGLLIRYQKFFNWNKVNILVSMSSIGYFILN